MGLGSVSGMGAQVWLGTAGWSYLPDWVGPFYPPGTSQSEALERYVEAFRFVEIDSTFYAPPALSTIERWASIFPETARVSCKAPKDLVQAVPFAHFHRTLRDGLGYRLSNIVVQMPPGFSRTPQNDLALRAFLQEWSSVMPIAVELRNNSWNHESVDELLRAHDVPRVSNDLHDVPDLERRCFDTSNRSAYIRLIGRHDGMSKDRIQRPQTEALTWWADHIDRLSGRGVKHIYVVANNHYEGHAPETLRTFGAALADRGLQVVPFRGFPDGQVSLF
jgi:uncharacterized protein YecE (DUF72 family)